MNIFERTTGLNLALLSTEDRQKLAELVIVFLVADDTYWIMYDRNLEFLDAVLRGNGKWGNAGYRPYNSFDSIEQLIDELRERCFMDLEEDEIEKRLDNISPYTIYFLEDCLSDLKTLVAKYEDK